MTKKMISLDELSRYDTKIKNEINKDTYELAGLSEYSASSTYAVGDYVYYNKLVYKCTTAIPVAEDWTSAHWTQVSLLDYLADKINGAALNRTY